VASIRFYNGYYVVQVRYLKLSRTGVYWYYRRIPRDLKCRYPGKIFIRKSLGTKDASEATKLAMRMALADDGMWQAMRSPKGQELGLMPQETLAAAEALLGGIRCD
jgi:hypothetical protein